ncbi:MAG: protein TolQ [Pseudomonadota bacterium]
MANDLDFFQLIFNASGVVQLVMLLLVVASVLSWAMIIDRSRSLKRARKRAELFEDRFWSGGEMSELYHKLGRGGQEGMAGIFHAGFREYLRALDGGGMTNTGIVANAQRAMRVATGRATDGLQRNLPFLATVGSTSPYVGLFGTVWGIMNAFHALSDVKQATLSLVAPGIAEALIATAMGLFAAIPAVIAYNRYSHDVEQLENRYEDFSEEFSNMLLRQLHAPRG